jgi:hypothetical protein
MFKNKNFSLKLLLTIDGWLYEGRWVIKAHSCLTNTGQTGKNFTQVQQQLIEDYRRITKMIFKIDQ